MLSTKSINFIDNLRLYLITSGKKETEVKEVTEELQDHLMELEKRGKDIGHIIYGTPASYMESIKNEMQTDYLGILKSIPIYFLGVIAYFIMGPAIRGEFELNMIQVIGFPLISVIALIMYVVFLQQAGKNQFSSKKLFFTAGFISLAVTALFILLLLGSNFIVEPFYQASMAVNWIVVAICVLIFVSLAIWSKTWFSIWIPTLLFIPDFLFRFSSLQDETVLKISAVSFVGVFIIIIISLFIKEKLIKAKR
ncbi:HAAS domain-containing protein [Lederbergia lenta]|uniref:Membrane protein n=1 Tax=Lederbergia lenta TaxID=1467 RepID=A0A2X4VH39_LEDLE|nr:hypothetical protein [Lederbergia lenta]MEC2323721.1 hypothetical protein [Lederbergia lenta]SQI51567.1 membrane protein [Lederbergia lenta]